MKNEQIYKLFCEYGIHPNDYRPLHFDYAANRQGITIFCENGDMLFYFPNPERYENYVGDERKTNKKPENNYEKVISNKHKIMSECGISEDVFNLFIIFLMTYGFENGDIPEEMLNLLPENVKKAFDILKE